MRISDWSSDVCSSDLHAVIEVAAGALADDDIVHHGLDRRHRCAADLVDAEAGHVFPSFRLHGGQAAHRAGATGCGRRSQRKSGRRLVPPKGSTAALLIALKAKKARSEEHTSELQSLMR